jgi:glycosyltransferase involved in cell wall biosynthesis
MIFLLYLSLFVILYTYLGYPLIIALLARFAARPWKREPWPAAFPTPISIVMAVHNGAALLPAQIEHLLSLEPALVREVLIVSDGSTDATNTILQNTCAPPSAASSLRVGEPATTSNPILQNTCAPPSAASSLRVGEPATISNPILQNTCAPPSAASSLRVGEPATLSDPRLRTFILPHQAGKVAALNHAIARATGDILLFIDIRPRVEPGALASLLQNFADPSVGCVAGELLISQQGNDATTSAVSGLYWRYEQWIRNCEAAVDSPVGVYGGFYAIRRALVTPAPAGLILDDMFQPLAIVRQGYRSVLDRSAIVVDRWPAKATGEFSRKVRTLAGNFQLCREAPWILSPSNRVLFQLVSHKLLRLAVPYFFLLLLAASAALGLHSAAFALFAALQLAFWLLAAIAIRRPVPLLQRLAAPASALLVLNAAAVVGLYTFLFTRGPLWRIWSPTAAPSDL